MIAEIAEATVRLGDMESEVTIMMDGAEFCDHAWLSKRNRQSQYKWSVGWHCGTRNYESVVNRRIVHHIFEPAFAGVTCSTIRAHLPPLSHSRPILAIDTAPSHPVANRHPSLSISRGMGISDIRRNHIVRAAPDATFRTIVIWCRRISSRNWVSLLFKEHGQTHDLPRHP